MNGSGREVVVIDAVRTPIGRGHREKGAYREVHAADLLGCVYTETIERADVDATDVDAAIAGCVNQFGEQGLNIARTAWLQEGLPIRASAQTVDLQCGSSQQAVGIAAAQIASGVHDVVVAAGVEHMGHVSLADVEETQRDYGRALTDRLLSHHAVTGQGPAAERLAVEYGVDREAMDSYSAQSHHRANAASTGGDFAREIVAVTTPGGVVEHDQGIRPDTTPEVLAGLRPAFADGGTITAGNASQISDGAAAVTLASRERAEELGLRPRARIVDQTSVGCDPALMLEGPIPATEAILRRNRMKIEDIDRFEVNEAFAPVVLAWAGAHGADMERVNVRGGAIALGHPLGSSGARLITTLLHLLEDEDAQLGLVTMCCAGGLGTATLLERL